MLLLDKIILAFLAFFFLSGFIRGFLKSLIGPIAFFFCLVAAIISFDVNRNMITSVFIATAGTLALAIVLNIFLMIILSRVDKEIRGRVFPVSRLLGSLINVAWQGNIMFLTIILLSTLPLQADQLDVLRQQIPQSKYMGYYFDKVINQDNRLKAIVASLSAMRDPEQIQMFVSTREFNDFRNEPKFQKFVNDPEVTDAIKNKDIKKLAQCEALRSLLTDDNAMYSLSKLAVLVYETNLRQIESTPDSKPTP